MKGAAFRDGQLESPAPGVISPEPMRTVAHPPPGPVLHSSGVLHSTGGGEKGAPPAARALQSLLPLLIPAPWKQPSTPPDSGHKGPDSSWRRGEAPPRACLWAACTRGCHTWGPTLGGLHLGACPGGRALRPGPEQSSQAHT